MVTVTAGRTREQYLAAIAKRVAGYRQDEIGIIGPNHVDRWVKQFAAGDQMIILREMDHILQNWYMSRLQVKTHLRRFIRTELVGQMKARDALRATRFLRIQVKGSSQAELVNLVDRVLRLDYGMALSDCGTEAVSRVVYIDDAIYTGNRLRYDLTVGGYDDRFPIRAGWINTAPPGCELIIFVLASHSRGEQYAMRHVLEAGLRRNVRIRGPIACLPIDNEKSGNPAGRIQFLWPKATQGHQHADEYVKLAIKRIADNDWRDSLFRPEGIPSNETLFTCSEGREIVERAFLTKGAELATSTEKDSIRPLGFEKLESLGLGTMFMTYRNIANNVPLVVWWNTAKWRALLPRKGPI